MADDDPITQDALDRELAHLRRDLKHLRELWDQQKDADVAALLIQTVELARRMDVLNHAHEQAKEMARTTVASDRYEEQMADLRIRMQSIKDGAADALMTAVNDLARQLSALKDQVQQDVAMRKGEAKVIGEAKAEASSARASAASARVVSWGAVFATVAKLMWDFFSGGTP
jgi:hypothetical protein